MSKSSPTSRSLQALRELGFTAQVVERRVPFRHTTIDLFGAIDILAVREGVGILGVQATSDSHHAARMEKARKLAAIETFIRAGGRFEVWSWGKRGERGKRKLWTLRREELTL